MRYFKLVWKMSTSWTVKTLEAYVSILHVYFSLFYHPPVSNTFRLGWQELFPADEAGLLCRVLLPFNFSSTVFMAATWDVVSLQMISGCPHSHLQVSTWIWKKINKYIHHNTFTVILMFWFFLTELADWCTFPEATQQRAIYKINTVHVHRLLKSWDEG